MARVASCPQCNHELLVPGEADGDSWAKCPECRAFFQVGQATSRELQTALLVDSSEQPSTGLDPQDAESLTVRSSDDKYATVEVQDFVDRQKSPKLSDDLEFDNLIDDPNATNVVDESTSPLTDVASADPEQQAVDSKISPEDADDLQLDDAVPASAKGDELAAAAQRIDEWFRSAKTVPDMPVLGADAEAPSVEEIKNDFVPTGPARVNATVDLDADDANELSAMADFDLDLDDEQPAAARQVEPAWDDTERLEGLLGDPHASAPDDFDAEFTSGDTTDSFGPDFTQDENSTDLEPALVGADQASISLFADSDSPEVDSSKSRAPRRERSLVRSLMLIVVAGLFGSAAGYYALLWMRGPSTDFLNVAHYLPKAALPASFHDTKQIVRSAPPVIPADATADVEPAAAEDTTEPQELPTTTDETAQPMPDVTAATEATPGEPIDQSTEVQADFTEGEPTTDAVAPASAVGERYSAAAEPTETGEPAASTATDVTTEKPATTDLTVDDLAPPETTPATDAATEPTEPADSALPAANEATDLATTTAAEPTTDAVADPITDAGPAANAIEVTIANAPSFTGDDLQASLDAAAKAQPQLVEGNFADSKAVAQAKGRSYAMLADLAQKAMFADASQQSTPAMVEQADELFHKTLADAHTRGEVAQILPRWIASPSRKHGGVFFAGSVLSHEAAGDVAECKVQLDGGETLTVLAPANAADQLGPDKPVAIVGWLVDEPATQVSGYTGSAKSPAIWTKKLIPLE